MKTKVELYSGTYRHYAEKLYQDIRKETFGEDIGQNSWLTAGEYRSFFRLLDLSSGDEVLEIATGSGGPAVFMVKETGCRLTGLEINENGATNAKKLAEENAFSAQMEFVQGDASERLPFAEASFDIVICIDSINHLKDRAKVLKEFYRVLKPGGRLLFTDPTVISGILTNEEIAVRSSIGFFLFVPLGENDWLLKEAGFTIMQTQDVTENMATVSIKWYNAREDRMDYLLPVEGVENFEGLQLFFNMVHILSSEKRLSRVMYLALK